MSETNTLIGYSGRTIGREELTLVPTPPAGACKVASWLDQTPCGQTRSALFLFHFLADQRCAQS